MARSGFRKPHIPSFGLMSSPSPCHPFADMAAMHGSEGTPYGSEKEAVFISALTFAVHAASTGIFPAGKGKSNVVSREFPEYGWYAGIGLIAFNVNFRRFQCPVFLHFEWMPVRKLFCFLTHAKSFSDRKSPKKDAMRLSLPFWRYFVDQSWKLFPDVLKVCRDHVHQVYGIDAAEPQSVKTTGTVADDFFGRELLSVFLHPFFLFFRRQRDEFVSCVFDETDGSEPEIAWGLVFHERRTAKVGFFEILRDFDCFDIHAGKDVADGILHEPVVETSPAVLYGNLLAAVIGPWKAFVVFQHFPDREETVVWGVFLHEGTTGRTDENGRVVFFERIQPDAAAPALPDTMLADQVLPDLAAVHP